ncbi:hypothetical protein HW532_05760 [Kaustia mangrovi]|uniref:Uncharacterized protein n=1 Tax=Kaustia mangrovi TaxID=2593653 RepID=A0A7S8C2P4_9HYPH|nr:hypothetical protein [Kaustia mangrovi]QPC42251.1 hypothetical protein HW532_05760 [Kaustia mangrovi]
MSSGLTCIVPLAGPDVVQPGGRIKPLSEVEGMPLVERAITSRRWWREGLVNSSGLIFVLRSDLPETAVIDRVLQTRFPGCRTVRLGGLTRGALLSAMAGSALVDRFDTPLCIDLVDILYEIDPGPVAAFLSDPGADGLVPWFRASEPSYSYLVTDDAGHVTETAEKRVISQRASAGTYFFRNAAVFLKAAAWSMTATRDGPNGGPVFVCPAYNGLIEAGGRIDAIEVHEVVPLSPAFHAPMGAG